MVYRRMIAAGICAGIMMLASATQSQVRFDTCTVSRTADGFVALRERPNVKSRLLARVRPGETLALIKFGDGGEVSGPWQLVEYFPGEIMPDRAHADFRKVRTGWIYARYLDECG
ncbi:MAG: SH3 domain-containing protein [Beijerinckiaceae bacterium]|nr:SH3 domain-containing protein [Brevundimonas sp.]MCZ8302014.1 SH3 domain-containing protein [Beijerinckiaceae bacterium]